jgi:hypothetical protein
LTVVGSASQPKGIGEGGTPEKMLFNAEVAEDGRGERREELLTAKFAKGARRTESEKAAFVRQHGVLRSASDRS